jgi:hypothetical protein
VTAANTEARPVSAIRSPSQCTVAAPASGSTSISSSPVWKLTSPPAGRSSTRSPA